MRVVTDTLGQQVGYDYDLLGNRSHLTYPYSTGSGQAGRIITTTLPNQVVGQNSYDAAHHLTRLRYTDANSTLLAEFQYQVDGLGQRQVVTETLLSPAYEEITEAYAAANGLLVLEAENGLVTPG